MSLKPLSTLTPVLMVMFFVGCDQAPTKGVDRIFLNGGVYLADTEHSWAEAVGIDNGEIVFVGGSADAQSLIGSNTEVTDLAGKMLMPGFHDGHAHVSYGGRMGLGCFITSRSSLEETRQQLNDCATANNYAPDEWVTGGGWELYAFGDQGPTSGMLDEVFPGNPVVLYDAFGHNAWVSSRALELAGITSKTPDPPQGVIVRDPETGEPTGTLRDAAMSMVDHAIEQVSDGKRYEGLLRGLEEVNRYGITAFIEPGASERKARLYKKAEENGALTARVILSLSPIDELPDSVGPELFDLLAKRDQFRGSYINPDSVKIYIDGVIETQTSTMIEAYSDGTNAAPFYEQGQLNLLYEQLDHMGLQIHTHAIGDGAIRIALDAYEHALFENGPNENGHQIVHLQLIDPTDQPRFGELNVAANFQCLWCYPDPYIYLAEDFVGKERVQQFYPVKSLQDAGALLVGGSDWDVTSLNPLEAIETAVRRQDPYIDSGPVLGENEEVDLVTALDMYTRNAAKVMRLETKTGTIAVGKRADLVVLDRNLFSIPATEISEAQVLLTLMDGKEVYRAGGVD